MKAFIKKLKYNPYEIADAIVIDLINIYEQIGYFYKKLLGKYTFLKKNKILKNIHSGKRIFVLGNGPSLNNFDLKKLKNEIVIMVNRSFDHPDYEIIKPKYHIILDPKLKTGQWPLKYLDIIHEKNPNVNLILNANWFYLKKFDEYKKKMKIFWVKSKNISLLFNNFNYDLTQNYSSLAVVGNGLSMAMYSGSRKIYILGVELNGVLLLIAGKDSHFSGKDPDYDRHTTWNWARDLNSNSRGIRLWYRFADHCKKNNIELINLSNRGILNFIPKEDFKTLFK